jgi:hypothetical protein
MKRRTPKRHAALLKKRREPTSRNDPILALIADYFYPCKVFHDDVHEIREIWSEDPTDEAHEAVGRLLLVYIYHWVSSLWVVAHAFRDVLKEAHPAVPGWSICSMRVPCAGDQRRAGGDIGWLGRDR